MTNPDIEIKKQEEIEATIKTALETGDTEEQMKALMQLADSIAEKILNEHKSMTLDMLSDEKVLTSRGVVRLTNEERKFYNAIIDTTDGFSRIEETLPPTIFNRVFEYLKEQHELLRLINFQAATATTQWLLRKEKAEGEKEVASAWWGELTSSIKEIEINSFETFDLKLNKLTAFIPVHKSMLDIGPEWLDRYVREYLAESMAIALEQAIINGSGKDEPIGMMRDLKGGTNADGTFREKAVVALTDLTPATLGKHIMAPLTKGGKRNVSDAFLAVNPLDFWEKIFAATCMLTPGGTYVFGVLPIPAKIIQCVAVPKGKMIAGLAKDYFMGVGAAKKALYSDEAMFIEDKRVYAQRMIANGRPIDNKSFLVFDISDLSVLMDDMKSFYVNSGASDGGASDGEE